MSMAELVTPKAPEAGVTKTDFRDAMAGLAAAVNVITSDGPHGRAGFTATAVCSVTDDPPTLLVCLNRSASAHATVMGNEALCVNTLMATQQGLSNLFGGKTPMAERFAAAKWHRGASGAPVLEGAAVSFDCRITHSTSVGTHDILFCEVLALQRHPQPNPLVYYGRGYHGLPVPG